MCELSRGQRDTSGRDISLTSMVSKVLCNILENRLLCVVEEKGLIAEQVIRVQKLMGLPPPALELLGRLS